jgi:predicted RNA binding protein YcfA (HicA-like mRNA interferase family)
VAINYGSLHSLTAREIVSALLHDGFVLDRQAGSHRHYLHSDGRRVTVTFHGTGGTFKLKTLKSMLEIQARWTEDDLRRLRLLK